MVGAASAQQNYLQTKADAVLAWCRAHRPAPTPKPWCARVLIASTSIHISHAIKRLVLSDMDETERRAWRFIQWPGETGTAYDVVFVVDRGDFARYNPRAWKRIVPLLLVDTTIVVDC